MAKSIKVNIGGKEYSLRGDNEKLIFTLANEVNEQLDALGSRHGEESAATLSTLAALNLAEKAYLEKIQKANNETYILDELHKMTSYLEGHLTN